MVPTQSKIWSRCDLSAISGGDSAMVSSVTRISTPASNAFTKISYARLPGWPARGSSSIAAIRPMLRTSITCGSSRSECTAFSKYGASSADAFDVVIPSLPGYGFSGKPTAPGWNPVRIAKAWTTLMRNLGYKKGDFPVTDRHAATMISFPAHEHLTEEQLAYTVQTVEEFYGA